jgi:phosphomannomutase
MEILNKIAYVFDVDGTLTPSRLQMDPEFHHFFLQWMLHKNVFFITGSDKDKTIEQIGEAIWQSANAAMQSCGNHVFELGKETFKIDWTPSTELIEYLDTLLTQSKYQTRRGNHIETRTGLVNFSVVGRNCTQSERESYYDWDSACGERLAMAQQIMQRFPELEASVGGQISIDIHPVGANKSQAKQWILNKLGNDTIIHFFGDKTEKGGNDYDLAKILTEPHRVYQVTTWQDTYDLLKFA